MGFVVSEGTIRSLNRIQQPSGTSIQLTDGVSMAYYELWRTQPAVRTAVSFLGRNIAQLALHSFRRKGDVDRERLIDHALPKLISRPNAWTTRYRMMDALVHDLAIFDRAYWQKVKTDDGTAGLIRIPPTMCSADPDSKNWLTPERFVVKGERGEKKIDAGDMVFFRGYSGLGDTEGVSPLESLRRTLSEEYEASRMREQVLRNGARMSGYLTRPAEADKWSPKARERFRSSWRSQYAGNGPQAGGTPILEDGMSFVKASQTAEELQYIEVRKLSRVEVASAYFIPPPMIGILDDATFSNITEQHKMLYQDTLGPWLTMITEEIALQLLPDVPDTDNVYIEFNLRDKLTGSFEERQAAITSAVGGPTMTPNEARALDNRPPLDGGDELIKPLNITQPGDQSPIPADPDEEDPVDDPEEDSNAD